MFETFSESNGRYVYVDVLVSTDFDANHESDWRRLNDALLPYGGIHSAIESPYRLDAYSFRATYERNTR